MGRLIIPSTDPPMPPWLTEFSCESTRPVVTPNSGLLVMMRIVPASLESSCADGNDVDRNLLDVFLALGRGDDDLGLIWNIAFLRNLHPLGRRGHVRSVGAGRRRLAGGLRLGSLGEGRRRERRG